MDKTLSDSVISLEISVKEKPSVTKQVFRWNKEMVEPLLNCFIDLKPNYQLKGLDFKK